jgi:uncharacterized protein (DUF2384 family)
VRVCSAENGHRPLDEALIRECRGDRDLASAIQYQCGPNATTWLREAIPALDGRSPASLIESHQFEALQKCLMRMP